jgi:hypothetical protein
MSIAEIAPYYPASTTIIFRKKIRWRWTKKNILALMKEL